MSGWNNPLLNPHGLLGKERDNISALGYSKGVLYKTRSKIQKPSCLKDDKH
jgi:hypothetical protein